MQIPGKTFFIYHPFDSYTLLMRDVLGVGGEHQDYADFDSLFAAYMQRMQELVDGCYGRICQHSFEKTEMYKTLSVRVSGWHARFVTLTKEWQDMIIERTATGL